MKHCLWVLGGNIDTVDGRTGKLTTEARTFACHVRVGSNAKTCFDGVVGSPPAPQTASFYLELADHDFSF